MVVADRPGQAKALMPCQRRPPPRPKLEGMRLSEAVLTLEELCVRSAMFISLLEVCALQTVCRATLAACSQDIVWEGLCRNRWPKSERPAANGRSWKTVFFDLLRLAQARFSKALPGLVSKARRKDGLPDLRKLHNSLKLSYVLTLTLRGRSAAADNKHVFRFSEESVNIFASSIGIRCSFASIKVSTPVDISLSTHSRALGTDCNMFTVDIQNARSWGQELASDENCRFVRSTCGHLLVAFWRDDSSVAGIFFAVHYSHIFKACFDAARCPAWKALAGPPAFDDIDQCLGLHDYSMNITLRGVKAECFHQCFYKIAAPRGQDFCVAEAPPACVVVQSVVEEHSKPGAAPGVRGKPPARGNAAGKPARSAHFEVQAPHKSGDQIPFPCTRPLQLAFQTPAFRSLIPDLFFVDVTVFDEHGHVFWAVCAPATLSRDAPSALCGERVAEVDFDRAGAEERTEVRWLCLADRGAAQLAVQLEFDAAGPAGAELPRVNTIVWLVEASFLNTWWGSRYE